MEGRDAEAAGRLGRFGGAAGGAEARDRDEAGGADRHARRPALNLVSSMPGGGRSRMTAPLQWQCRDRDPRSRRARGDGRAQRHARFLLRRRPLRERRSGAAHALRMIEEGAAIIDVGGESTRPGAAAGRRRRGLERVVPVIEALRRESDVLDLRRHQQARGDARRGCAPAPTSSTTCARCASRVRSRRPRRRERGDLPHAHAGRAAHHAGRPAL